MCRRRYTAVASRLLAGTRLHLFFVGSYDEMKTLGYDTHGAWSIPEEGTAFFIGTKEESPALRHESMHLLSWRLWGAPSSFWISEGLGDPRRGPLWRLFGR